MYMKKQGTLVLVFLAIVAGCAGPASRTVLVDDQDKNQVAINWAEHEDFDVLTYAEEQPSPRPVIEHDAPAALLAGTLGKRGVPGQQAGFRIQILSTQDREEADQVAAQAVAWWQQLAAEGALEDVYPGPESTPPVYQDFRAPYYRVRVGNFVLRAQAERMLPVVEDRYASAFIAPDQIVIK